MKKLNKETKRHVKGVKKTSKELGGFKDISKGYKIARESKSQI